MITVLKAWLMTRARKRPCTTIVLHGTAGASGASSVSWLRQIGLSYHYVVDRDGSVIKCAPTSRVAFHAGKSVGPEGENVNDYSIGIAFANLEDGRDKITLAQLDAVASLVKQLEPEFPLKWVTTHYAISPRRKTDPVMLKAVDLIAFAARVNLTAWLGAK